MYKTAETVSPGHPDKIADLISDYAVKNKLVPLFYLLIMFVALPLAIILLSQ